MSVAALSIAMMSYGQCTTENKECCEKTIQEVYEYEGLVMGGITKEEMYEKSVKTFQEIDMRIDDIVDAIRMDMFYGRITQDNGMYYINEVIALKSKNEDLMSDLFKNKIQ